MKKYGLIGNPLGHSFSQQYFRDKFRTQGIADADYLNFELTSLDEEISLLKRDKDLSGLNVTIPYKSAILPFLDDATEAVDTIKACNCINVVGGKWIGHNADIVGFQKSFVELLKPYHKKALVLGTGGSSKAVAYVLKEMAIDFLFITRNPKEHALSYTQLDKKTIGEYLVIINTTPLGMFPNVDAQPEIPYQYLSNMHYCYDLVYNPPLTNFLKLAAKSGASIKNGSDMLVIQAEESWRIWNS